MTAVPPIDKPLGAPFPITYPPSGGGPRPVDAPIVEQKK